MTNATVLHFWIILVTRRTNRHPLLPNLLRLWGRAVVRHGLELPVVGKMTGCERERRTPEGLCVHTT
jgi:hypothetical protein